MTGAGTPNAMVVLVRELDDVLDTENCFGDEGIPGGILD